MNNPRLFIVLPFDKKLGSYAKGTLDWHQHKLQQSKRIEMKECIVLSETCLEKTVSSLFALRNIFAEQILICLLKLKCNLYICLTCELNYWNKLPNLLDIILDRHTYSMTEYFF